MKSTPKRIVSLLFLLLLSAVMMTGCIKANIDVVGGEVTAASSSGKLRLLLKQPMMDASVFPAKDLTLEEVSPDRRQRICIGRSIDQQECFCRKERLH